MYFEVLVRKGLSEKETCKPHCEVWEGTGRLQVREEFSKNEKEGSSLRTEVFLEVSEELNGSLSSVNVIGRERVKHLLEADSQVPHCGNLHRALGNTSYFLEHCHWCYSCDPCNCSHSNPFEVGVAVLIVEVSKPKPVESHTFSKWWGHSKLGLFKSNDAFTRDVPTLC